MRFGWRALALGASGIAAAVWLSWSLLVHLEAYPRERLDVRDASSLIVLDRNGRLLWQAGSQNGERRSWTSLTSMAPVALRAHLASEDHRFYEHRGVDPWGVLRAVWLNLRARRSAYGASTISMQLVRLLEPELESRTLWGKLRQALHAARLERIATKPEILEQYLNRAYYGNGAFGLEAAAQLYFGTSAGQLSAGQAAFLAALPRAPRAYDPYLHRPRAEQRMRHILGQMQRLSWLSAAELQLARDSPLTLRSEHAATQARHFIDHLLLTLPREQLRGARLHTTLDLDLQERLEVATRRHLLDVGSRGVSQAGVIVLDNRSGDILAMVGSRNYDDAESDGAVNITARPRRAGSTLKPFVYALAIERGHSPATLAYDVVLPGEANETYTADVRQHGFARYREALAGSYNLAAVHTLDSVGVRALVDRLRLAGVTTLDGDARKFDLDLAIGNAEIELGEYAGAFAAFGNQGRAVRPRALLHVEVGRNEPSPPRAPGPLLTPVFSPAVAYQVFDMLSDPDARRPMFGRSAPLELLFPVALKTGTTRGYTDNLAFGTTRQYTVGAWAGNFDGSPTEGVMAMQGAAPLVRAAFVALAALYGDPTAPERPPELTERDICPLSGKQLGPFCPGRKRESFTPLAAAAFDRARPCDFHVKQGREVVVALPEELRHWARVFGVPNAGRASAGESRALSIVYPGPGSIFQLDPHRPARYQVPPLRALPDQRDVRFTIDGVAAHHFEPSPGRHRVRAEQGQTRAEVDIIYE